MYNASDDVSSDPLIIGRLSPDEKEQDMDNLVNKALFGTDANCPVCDKKGKAVPMYRSTNPRHIEYPDLLLITIGR